jgi:hypothetical protein
MLPGGGSHPRVSEDGGIPFSSTGRRAAGPPTNMSCHSVEVACSRWSRLIVKNLVIFEISSEGAYDSIGTDVLSSSDME